MGLLRPPGATFLSSSQVLLFLYPTITDLVVYGASEECPFTSKVTPWDEETPYSHTSMFGGPLPSHASAAGSTDESSGRRVPL